ncbi:MAG: hypothetical protein ACI9L9_002544, partial [Marivirga sp.]
LYLLKRSLILFLSFCKNRIIAFIHKANDTGVADLIANE